MTHLAPHHDANGYCECPCDQCMLLDGQCQCDTCPCPASSHRRDETTGSGIDPGIPYGGGMVYEGHNRQQFLLGKDYYREWGDYTRGQQAAPARFQLEAGHDVAV